MLPSDRLYDAEIAGLILSWLSRLNYEPVLSALKACPCDIERVWRHGERVVKRDRAANPKAVEAWAQAHGFGAGAIILAAALLRETWEEYPRLAGEAHGRMRNIRVSVEPKPFEATVLINPKKETLPEWRKRADALYRDAANAQGLTRQQLQRSRTSDDWPRMDLHVKWFVIRQVKRLSYDDIAAGEPNEERDGLDGDSVRKAIRKVADALGGVVVRTQLAKVSS